MYHLEGGDGKPSKSNLEWQPIGTRPMASQFLCFTGPVVHSTVYLNTCQHPRGGEIAPDPLKLIPSKARERGNCLMKMDHNDGFTFHFLTASIRLYYSQFSPLSSLSLTRYSGGSVHSFWVFVPFLRRRVCLYMGGYVWCLWLPECKI